MQTTRRAVLKAGVLTAGASAVAGCLSGPEAELPGGASADATYTGYASFFAPWDWAEHVGGDEWAFENPVDSGRMGHGWSPDGNIAGRIASTDLFLYLDTPEFSWAQNVAGELRRDYDDVVVVDLLEGLEPFLIPFDGDELPDPDPDASIDPDDLLFDEFDIYDMQAQQQLGYWHDDHWHGGLPDVLLDASAVVGVSLEDENERVVPLGESGTYRVDARIADGEDRIVDIESHGDRIEFHGVSTGSTAVVFEFYREGELVYETAAGPAPIEVVESFEGDGAQDFHDPHVWVDPPIVARMVDRIADVLGEIDPDNAGQYRANADAYGERIMDVHEELETIVAEATHDRAVFAGHDSFQYVERRYGFDLHSPTGVTPDATASPEDISGLIDVIESTGIDTVLYDPFESPDPGEQLPQLVEVLFENTRADRAEPLTPAEGTTAEWAENDWGWIEQMEEINLPSLRAALDA